MQFPDCVESRLDVHSAWRKNYVLELEAFYSVLWKHSKSSAGEGFEAAREHSKYTGICDLKAIPVKSAARQPRIICTISLPGRASRPSCSIVHWRGALSGRQRTMLVP